MNAEAAIVGVADFRQYNGPRRRHRAEQHRYGRMGAVNVAGNPWTRSMAPERVYVRYSQLGAEPVLRYGDGFAIDPNASAEAARSAPHAKFSCISARGADHAAFADDANHSTTLHGLRVLL
jgi:hypothetical protein